MKIDLTKILLIVIIVLMGLLSWKWNKKPEVIEKIITKDIIKTTTKTDTIKIVEYVYLDTLIITKPILVVDTTYKDNIVDTASIINMFRDTIILPNYGSISLTDYIRDNSILYRETKINLQDLKESTTINTNTPYEVKIYQSHVYIGGTVVLGQDNWNLFISATFVTKHKGLFGVGYDPFNKAIMGKAELKLF